MNESLPCVRLNIQLHADGDVRSYWDRDMVMRETQICSVSWRKPSWWGTPLVYSTNASRPISMHAQASPAFSNSWRLTKCRLPFFRGREKTSSRQIIPRGRKYVPQHSANVSYNVHYGLFPGYFCSFVNYLVMFGGKNPGLLSLALMTSSPIFLALPGCFIEAVLYLRARSPHLCP